MARKTHTEAQARYDKVNRRVYGFRLHNEIDSDIIAKLASVDSMQGYIKQLIREDLNRTCPGTVTICFGKSSIDILARIADEKGLSVPDLISVIVNEQLVRCHSVPESAPETEREEPRALMVAKAWSSLLIRTLPISVLKANLPDK